MFEHAQLVLYKQFTEERLWGLALLAFSIGMAAPPTWYGYQTVSGYAAYAVAFVVFFVVFFIGAKVWGIVLSKVRNRWFA